MDDEAISHGTDEEAAAVATSCFSLLEAYAQRTPATVALDLSSFVDLVYKSTESWANRREGKKARQKLFKSLNISSKKKTELKALIAEREKKHERDPFAGEGLAKQAQLQAEQEAREAREAYEAREARELAFMAEQEKKQEARARAEQRAREGAESESEIEGAES